MVDSDSHLTRAPSLPKLTIILAHWHALILDKPRQLERRTGVSEGGMITTVTHTLPQRMHCVAAE